eukprot:Nk52_evm76s217 gene=Nk52_evmTU76s217
MDFLNGHCGKVLLGLTARGSSIAAEILRLSKFIPKVFELKDKKDKELYAQLLLDFVYYTNQDHYDEVIDNDKILFERDLQLRNENIDILVRFYLLFESIYQYALDFVTFIEDLDSGTYIHLTIDNVLMDNEGRQLLCESLYLYGVQLLLLDQYIPGVVRERILVAYSRYIGDHNLKLKTAQAKNLGLAGFNAHNRNNMDDICKLMRSTGLVLGKGDVKSVIPLNYPEEYFRRIPIPHPFVQRLIGRLRSDDVYQQLTIYPVPEHRSHALSTQGSMLYVVLYFYTSILHDQTAIMREIVDKFFPDNWIVHVYMGDVVNLVDVWDGFKAARSALSNTINSENIQKITISYASKVDSIYKQLSGALVEGFLSDKYVLSNCSKLVNALIVCNVCLRWLTLHTCASSSHVLIHSPTGKSRKISETVVALANRSTSLLSHKQRHQLLSSSSYFWFDKHSSESSTGFENVGLSNIQQAVVSLLLNTAHLEYKFRNMLEGLLKTKEDTWNKSKENCSSKIEELARYFGGEGFGTSEKNEELQKWFSEIALHIKQLDIESQTVSARRLVHIVEALDDVQEFHQIETSVTVQEYLAQCREILKLMLRTLSIEEVTLANLQVVTDLSYAWNIVKTYKSFFQLSFKKDPSIILKMRATFLKLSSALDLPLIRISQINSADLDSVSRYYSGCLVSFVSDVLQIIPQSMFVILEKIIQIQTNYILEVPTKLEVTKLGEYAQLKERYEVAKLTHSISVYTEGILAMKTTLFGIIKIDPKSMLEDGIRRELVYKISKALHSTLVFVDRGKSRDKELLAKLAILSGLMDGLRRSFEYIQDYVNIYGLKMWNEEFGRIISYYLERECNSFLQYKVRDDLSVYQSSSIPIPTFQRPQGDVSVNFIGRVGREIVRLSHFAHSVYVPQSCAWFSKERGFVVMDPDSHFEVLGFEHFRKLQLALGARSLVALDKFYSFMIASDLNEIFRVCMASCRNGEPLDEFIKAPPGKQPKIYLSNVSRSSLSKVWSTLGDLICKTGTLQLLRSFISSSLKLTSRLTSPVITLALDTLNAVVMEDMRDYFKDPEHFTYPGGDDNELLFELGEFLDGAGTENGTGLQKIFCTPPFVLHLPRILFLFTIVSVMKMEYCSATCSLVGKKGAELDGIPFVLGISTVLKQFHPRFTRQYLIHLTQFVKSFIIISVVKEKKISDFPLEARLLATYLKSFFDYNDNVFSDLKAQIPDSVSF